MIGSNRRVMNSVAVFFLADGRKEQDSSLLNKDLIKDCLALCTDYFYCDYLTRTKVLLLDLT